MSPRQYRSEGRHAAAAGTRARIVEAARALLAADNPGAFTIEAVAEKAGVARMTVYNQFGSKPGLVEAVSDDLAQRGGIERLPEAFQAENARAGIEILIEVFVRLWASERLVVRGLRAVSALDPELAHADRNQRRRRALLVLLGGMVQDKWLGSEDLEAKADLLLVLTSFEAYESLAAGRDTEAVIALVKGATRAILDFLPPGPSA